MMDDLEAFIKRMKDEHPDLDTSKVPVAISINTEISYMVMDTTLQLNNPEKPVFYIA